MQEIVCDPLRREQVSHGLRKTYSLSIADSAQRILNELIEAAQ
jgi:hypothetical protein